MKRNSATVKVHIYDDCNVDCEAVNVSKDSGDEIEWHSTGAAFTIKFESSPFKDREFVVPAGGCQGSGPLKDSALFVTYHYKIEKIGSQQAAADPDINVKH
jgi:hypothetical protein